MRVLANERRRFGCRRLHILLAREGHRLNHKKLFRLYRAERLGVVNVPTRSPSQRSTRSSQN